MMPKITENLKERTNITTCSVPNLRTQDMESSNCFVNVQADEIDPQKYQTRSHKEGRRSSVFTTNSSISLGSYQHDHTSSNGFHLHVKKEHELNECITTQSVPQQEDNTEVSDSTLRLNNEGTSTLYTTVSDSTLRLNNEEKAASGKTASGTTASGTTVSDSTIRLNNEERSASNNPVQDSPLRLNNEEKTASDTTVSNSTLRLNNEEQAASDTTVSSSTLRLNNEEKTASDTTVSSSTLRLNNEEQAASDTTVSNSTLRLNNEEKTASDTTVSNSTLRLNNEEKTASDTTVSSSTLRLNNEEQAASDTTVSNSTLRLNNEEKTASDTTVSSSTLRLNNEEKSPSNILSSVKFKTDNNDSFGPNHTKTHKKSSLVNRTEESRSPDVDEIKSVKFNAPNEYSKINEHRNVKKKNQVAPLRDIHATDIDILKAPSRIIATISDIHSVEILEKDQSQLHGVEQSTVYAGYKEQTQDAHAEVDSPTPVRTGLCRCANLSTQQGRRNHALLIMLVSVVPVAALLIQNSIVLSESHAELDLHKTVKYKILFSVEAGNVVHRTQIERGITSLYVSSKGDAQIKDLLVSAYAETDKEIDKLTLWIAEPGIDHFRSVESYHGWIKDFRDKLISVPVPNVTVSEVINFYSDDNDVITRWVGNSIQQSKSDYLWKTLAGYYMLILSKEQADVERALGSTFYAQGGFDNKEMLDYMERKILGVAYLERCKDYSARVKTLLQEQFIGQEIDLSVQRMREEILQNSTRGGDLTMGSMWFWNMTQYINILKEVQDSIALDIVEGLKEEMEDLTSVLIESICVMVAALLLFPFVILAVYRLTNRIQNFAQTLQVRTRDLDIERKRSETLLFELLPVSVAKKLLNHEEVPPVSYSAVTLFFSDIVGFTTICGKSTPMQVIDMLNNLYRLFDDIIDKHDVYKVETIGDAYLVVSGLPQQNLDGHATEMANFALDIRETISHMTVKHLQGQSLQMRIGLNSGPVVAGVVGQKMPRYCLFGDTVNVASKMESTSLPLHIQISESCRRELVKKGDFIIRERGKIEVKGKGEITTYWLDERILTEVNTD